MVATWGFLQGLSESEFQTRSYIGIDLHYPASDTLALAKKLAKKNHIIFDFWKANDMYIEMLSTDLLFIDSMHTYAHLTFELEKFCGSVVKYIALHDTSKPWEDTDDREYTGDYSEYPEWIDRTKRGLWPAVEDFLIRHPEWTLKERKFNNHGLTILERLSH